MSEVVYRRCCGLDVHKDTSVVCVLPPVGQSGTAIRKVYRTFRNDLTRMRGWLKLLKVTEIAMESTRRLLASRMEGFGGARFSPAVGESGPGQSTARAQERPA